MHEMYLYHIEVRGHVDGSTLNATSPLQMTVVRSDAAATLLAAYADQSALVGLIRHLHRQGFVLLSVYRSCQT